MLVLFVSGLTLKVTIDFASPVNESSDVVMTCQYTYNGTGEISTKWLRQKESGAQITKIWSCKGNTQQTLEDRAAAGLENKFRLLSTTLCANGHAIQLLDAQKEDEGTYQCSVTVHGQNSSIATKQLDVHGAWFSFFSPPAPQNNTKHQAIYTWDNFKIP